MYKIIGADGKEYGPISGEQLRRWISEGRVTAQTKILPEGTTEWKPLSEFSEFASTFGGPPPLTPVFQAPTTDAARKVAGPAIGLIVTAGINILFSLLRFIAPAIGLGASAAGAYRGNPDIERIMAMSGKLSVVFGGIGLIGAILILLGGIKMRKLESYGLCMAASILAMVPCLSACCIIGLPFGIWSLIVLSKPEVKAAFH